MLKLSNDRKVSPLSVWKASAKRWEPVVPNSIGLSAGKPGFDWFPATEAEIAAGHNIEIIDGMEYVKVLRKGSCPGATSFCNGCYALRTEKVFTSAGRLVRHNLDELEATDTAGMAHLLAQAVEAFLVKLEKEEAKRGVKIDRVFRIHWDGDIFSSDYARAWARVMRAYPSVQFWLYTRSYEYVAVFEGIANVAVYLSVDAENAPMARLVKAMHPFVKLAFCADTWEATEALAASFEGERMGPRCPELTGKLEMVGSDGKGACVTCGLCVYGKNNVRFAKEKG